MVGCIINKNSFAWGFLVCWVAYRFDPENSGADFTPREASCITLYLGGDASVFASLWIEWEGKLEIMGTVACEIVENNSPVINPLLLQMVSSVQH